MISRWRGQGALPRAVSRRISAQVPSSESVKCRTHIFCSASGAGTSCLQPGRWQFSVIRRKKPENRFVTCSASKIQQSSLTCCEMCSGRTCPVGHCPSESRMFTGDRACLRVRSLGSVKSQASPRMVFHGNVCSASVPEEEGIDTLLAEFVYLYR